MKRESSLFYRSSLLAVSLALLAASLALAASGDLDPTFSGDGRIIQGFGGREHWGVDVAVQADGKLVAVGQKYLSSGQDFAVARYTTAGVLDPTFSGDGRQVISLGTYDRAFGIAIQADGKIVVGGKTCNADFLVCDVALARLNPDGSLDAGFGAGGKVITDFASGDDGAFDLGLQGSKIVLAGYLFDGSDSDAAVYRYNPDGSLDKNFSGDGIQPIDFGREDSFGSIRVVAGRIYVAGRSRLADGSTSDMVAARLNSNGSLDTTFSRDGKISLDLGADEYVKDLAVMGGKVVILGYSGDEIALLRYTAAGELDPTFSGDGVIVTDLGFPAPRLFSITPQGGKLVLAGRTDASSASAGDALLVRYTPAGTLDPTFGTGGIVTTDWDGAGDRYNSILFKNSRLYTIGESRTAAGVSRFIVAAYLP